MASVYNKSYSKASISIVNSLQAAFGLDVVRGLNELCNNAT